MKRFLAILLALVLCAMSMPTLGEAEIEGFSLGSEGHMYFKGFYSSNYDGFVALEEDGLCCFNEMEKTKVVPADCTPSAGLLFNGQEGYALKTGGESTQLIHLNAQTGESRVAAQLDPKMKKLAGIIGNYIYLLGGDDADKNGITGEVLYRQEIGSDVYTIVHRGISKVGFCSGYNFSGTSGEARILALGWQYDPVPVECAVISQDSRGMPRVEYLTEYVLDLEDSTLWTCDAVEREGDYNTVCLKTYSKGNDGSYGLWLQDDPRNVDDIIPGGLSKGRGIWMDVKGYFGQPGLMVLTAGYLHWYFAHPDASVYDVYQDGITSSLRLYVYKQKEHRIYEYSGKDGKLYYIAENIPAGAELLCCVSHIAYLRAKGSDEIFAVELADVENSTAAPAATPTPVPTAVPTPVPAAVPTATPAEQPQYEVAIVDFSKDDASYNGTWTMCCEGSYEVYLPNEAVEMTITPEMKDVGYIEGWLFMEGMIGVRHFSDPDGSYHIMDAYFELLETCSEENMMLCEMNGVFSLMYLDDVGGTLNLIVPDSLDAGAYHFVAVGGTLDFEDAAYDLYDSIHVGLG